MLWQRGIAYAQDLRERVFAASDADLPVGRIATSAPKTAQSRGWSRCRGTDEGLRHAGRGSQSPPDLRRAQSGQYPQSAEFEYDPDVISHWELWLGHKAPKSLVIGQDFGNVDYFVRNRGRDEPDNKTNENLWKLLTEAGIRAKHPRELEITRPKVFLTNSVLCLETGER